MVSYLTLSTMLIGLLGLNPCCSGRWPRTLTKAKLVTLCKSVLILVVVEDGLVQIVSHQHILNLRS